jgi:hypothetical protein
VSCVWGVCDGSGECCADLVEGSISVRDGKGGGKKKETNQKYFIVERVPDRLCPSIDACGCSSDSLIVKSTFTSFKVVMASTPVSQTCLMVTCRNTRMDFLPEGHNPKFPWLITIVCPMCNTPKFMCTRSCTTGNKDGRKSKFYSNMRQVQRHHSRCHKIFKGIRTQQPSSDESMEQNDNDSSSLNISQDVVSQGCIHDDVSLSLSNSGDDDAPEYCNPVSGIDSEIRTSNTNHDLAMDIHHIETSPQVAIMESTRDKFWKTIVQGNILEAASLLVSQAAFQSPNLFNANLPLPNIMLFIHLGKLVISSGLTDQYNLAKILSILYP